MGMLSGLLVLHVVICVTGNIIDLTCYVSSPTIDRRGNDDVIIGGYKSGADTDIDVEFGRESFTGTGSGLPSESVQFDHPSGNDVAELLGLPGPAGTERIGAFYCQATKYGITERIVTTILASLTDTRYVTPDQISITANMGESVTLSITPKDLVAISGLRWRHSSGDTMWFGQTSHTISSVSMDDAGVYECHTGDTYRNGNHAIMQLIVRACTAGRWGPPACTNACPHCYNGGICDDRSGLCVCAPGFSGTTCQTVHGSNRWGQDGQRVCSSSNGNDPHSAACRGALFCLPHPYGCTCAAGYYGIDCDQDCQEGTYGGNCRSQCHCAVGVSCLADTGECSDGQCHPDWYGVNCQLPCPDQGSRTVTDLQGQAAETNIVVQWERETSPCSHFILMYDVSDNLEQCRSVMESQEHLLTSNQFEISNVRYYSTYTITVRIRGSQTSESVTVMTEQTEPSAPPSNITVGEVTSDILAFHWLKPPCGTRHGEIISYSFILINDTGVVVQSGSTSSSDVTIEHLTPFTGYMFQVAAVTNAGEGPLSDSLSVSTKQAAPSNPINLRTVEVTRYSINMTWDPPEQLNGIIEGYSVASRVVAKPYDRDFIASTEPDIERYINHTMLGAYTFVNLSPSTKYELQVVAHNAGGKGLGSSVTIFTGMVTVKDISKPPMILSKTCKIPDDFLTSTTVQITFPLSNSEYVTGYQVGVESPSPTIQKRQTNPNVSESFYVAAEITKSDIDDEGSFIVGDDGTYGMFHNKPLSGGQTYTLYTAFVSRLNNTSYVAIWSDGVDVTMPDVQEVQNGTAQITTVILVSLLCISAIAHVATTYYILRSKNKQLKQDPTPATMAAPPPPPTTTSNPGSGERIQMSLDGYVEYKPGQPESTYQGIREDAQGDGTYAEIPVPINTTNLVSPDDDNIDDGAYTNDSVVRQPRGSKQPQKKPDQAGIYEVSM